MFHLRKLEKAQVKSKVSKRKYQELEQISMKLKTRNQQRKFNKTKSSFFEKINKIGKPLAKITKEKKGGHKQLISEMKEGNITTHTMAIKRNTMHISMPINFITYAKWTDSLKDTICQN